MIPTGLALCLKTACPFLVKPQVHEDPGNRVHLASGSRAVELQFGRRFEGVNDSVRQKCGQAVNSGIRSFVGDNLGPLAMVSQHLTNISFQEYVPKK